MDLPLPFPQHIVGLPNAVSFRSQPVADQLSRRAWAKPCFPIHSGACQPDARIYASHIIFFFESADAANPDYCLQAAGGVVIVAARIPTNTWNICDLTHSGRSTCKPNKRNVVTEMGRGVE
jgi:hypothetical protein